MKKLFLLSVFTVTFSYSQVSDENGSLASNSGGSNLFGNIGIGITPSSSSPYKLAVNGAGRFISNLLVGDPLGARTEINTSTNHKVYAPTNKKTIDLDGNYHGGGFMGVYRADNGKHGVDIRSQPNVDVNSINIYEMRYDNTSKVGINMFSRRYTGETNPTNVISLPNQNSTIVIGQYGSYKKGQGYGLISKLKTNFENDVFIETGNLGIGTNSFNDGSDIYKLSVNGKVRAHAIKVYTDWADFVFESNYNLPTLKDVETYINKNGHLKNIPSAKEVEENGIELGEMNKLLLQKIEELTLYTIGLKKEIDDLKSKME